MSPQVMALYDVTGIQRYIYNSNKLKDIIGASELVRWALDEGLVLSGEDSRYNGKRVYTGGGSAVLAFDSQDAWKTFNRVFTRRLLRKVPGLSVISVSNENIEDREAKRIRDLFGQMDRRKGMPRASCDFNTLPPMAQTLSDQRQITYIDTSTQNAGDYSFAEWRKNEVGRDIISKEKEEEEEKTYLQFEKIADPVEGKGENMLAVVHLDGNQMGKLFSAACDAFDSGDKVGVFSQDIDTAFEESYKAALKVIGEFPQRKIYINGDDVNFVCQSAYALKTVIEIMKALQEHRKDSLQDLSAAAGIAYVKSHFPFYRAYEIAEHRCKLAKDEARKVYGSHDSNDIGCWVDFEIVRGSANTSLMEDKYLRPYCIIPPNGKKLCIKNDIGVLFALLKEINKETQDDEIPARNKLKKLRNSFLMGDSKEAVLLNMKSRAKSLAGEYELGEGKTGTNHSFKLTHEGKLTDSKDKPIANKDVYPLFDVLDLMDLEVLP